MSQSWEERYLEDILPVIEEYAEEETTGFTSQDIAERLDDYSSQLVGKTLKYMTENDETRHVIYTGNHPKTWEAVLLDGVAWERVENELDIQPQESEDEKEVSLDEAAEEVFQEYPEEDYGRLQSVFLSKIEDSKASTARKIQSMSEKIDQQKPTVSREILEFDPGTYGKMRKYFDEVYRELKEISEERSGFFNSVEISQRLEDAPSDAAGHVLKGLEKAGLVEGYDDKKGYFPESIDTEELREFGRAVKNAETLDELREKLDWKED